MDMIGMNSGEHRGRGHLDHVCACHIWPVEG